MSIASAELAKVGERKRGIEDVQNYLRRLGYMREGVDFKPGEVDDITSEALTAFQIFNGLPPTGEFESATKDKMTKGGCGLPDMHNGLLFVTSCRWNQRGLTYAFLNGTNQIPGQDESQAVRNAFRTWASIVPITFTEVGINTSHEIEIAWVPESDPDFDLEGGYIAHADTPPGCGNLPLPKPVHFDNSETYAIGSASGAWDVESVALHEIGHILGLRHSTVLAAVMHRSTAGRSLHPDDIAGIRRLYSYPPAVVSRGSNRLDVFGLGMTEAMFHKAWDGNSWEPSLTDWQNLGGILRSPLSAVSWGSNRLDVFGLGTDGAMYHKWWDGNSWEPSITGWESLGGVFLGGI